MVGPAGFPPAEGGTAPRTFFELPPDEQAVRIKKRLQEYSRKVYKRGRETQFEEREDIVCQREHRSVIGRPDAREHRARYKSLAGTGGVANHVRTVCQWEAATTRTKEPVVLFLEQAIHT